MLVFNIRLLYSNYGSYPWRHKHFTFQACNTPSFIKSLLLRHFHCDNTDPCNSITPMALGWKLLTAHGCTDATIKPLEIPTELSKINQARLYVRELQRSYGCRSSGVPVKSTAFQLLHHNLPCVRIKNWKAEESWDMGKIDLLKLCSNQHQNKHMGHSSSV